MPQVQPSMTEAMAQFRVTVGVSDIVTGVAADGN